MFSAALPNSSSCQKIVQSMKLIPNFLSQKEVDILYSEVNPHLLKLKYLNSHWDNAIVKYREMEKEQWSKTSLSILAKQYSKIFKPENLKILPKLHVLDLHQDGYVSAHVDSIDAVGKIVSGICLLSGFLFRLKPTNNPGEYVDFYIRPGSLFAMSEYSRYECTHQVLKNEESFYDGVLISRTRMIALMMRDVPIQNL